MVFFHLCFVNCSVVSDCAKVAMMSFWLFCGADHFALNIPFCKTLDNSASADRGGVRWRFFRVRSDEFCDGFQTSTNKSSLQKQEYSSTMTLQTVNLDTHDHSVTMVRRLRNGKPWNATLKMREHLHSTQCCSEARGDCQMVWHLWWSQASGLRALHYQGWCSLDILDLVDGMVRELGGQVRTIMITPWYHRKTTPLSPLVNVISTNSQAVHFHLRATLWSRELAQKMATRHALKMLRPRDGTWSRNKDQLSYVQQVLGFLMQDITYPLYLFESMYNTYNVCDCMHIYIYTRMYTWFYRCVFYKINMHICKNKYI